MEVTWALPLGSSGHRWPNSRELTSTAEILQWKCDCAKGRRGRRAALQGRGAWEEASED